MRQPFSFLIALGLLAACQPADQPVSSVTTQPVVQTGAEVLAADGFAPLQGKRVGLVVNHTARIDSVHLIDAIHGAEGVELAALFGPEHGLRGTADAGEKVDDGVDDKTGVPIYSLYGANRKPSSASLAGLDALVFDIQDVGVRFYTYISTMGHVMQAASEAGIPFYVLDRPNPLGGLDVAGYIREPEQTSFVGLYPIPIVHGMTVGELARMVQVERMLDGLESLDLTVIPMEGWNRAMRWPATGHEWIPSSPNIPDFETALIYPGTCFFEATKTVSEGRGTRTPFKHIGGDWIDAQAFADKMAGVGLSGVRFEMAEFTPISIEGMASTPRFQDELLAGVKIVVEDIDAYRPVETGIYLLSAVYEMADDSEALLNETWLARLAGTNQLKDALDAGTPPDQIIAGWSADVEAFRKLRAPFLLYP